jgi:CBS domain-containing protein
MDSLELILQHKGSQVYVTSPEVMVSAAVDSMCRARIGALLVMKDDEIAGIFSERDLMTRVVLAGRAPGSTRVGDVMTREVVCVSRNGTVRDAMALATRRRVRHLPLMDGSHVVGIVSIGDLVRWRIRDYEEEISQLRGYIAGYPAA